MKKGWQQIMLYLIVLTSYGCLSDEDKCIRQLVQGRPQRPMPATGAA